MAGNALRLFQGFSRHTNDRHLALLTQSNRANDKLDRRTTAMSDAGAGSHVALTHSFQS